MARYGIDYYGRSYYGNITLANYDATPFTVNSVDYAKLLCEWTTPSGYWTGIRLIRNIHGFPETADDGIILVDQTRGSTSTSTISSYYDPAPPETPIIPHTNTQTDPNAVREITYWFVEPGQIQVTVNDATYITLGCTISIYGGTEIDGTWLVSSVNGNTLTIATVGTELAGGYGTSGYVYVNELQQGRFYYYSVFCKILTNTLSVTGASAVKFTDVAYEVTYTTATPHTYAVGNYVGVMNMPDSDYNILNSQVLSVTSTTFTVYAIVSETTCLGGGTAGINTQWVRAGNATGLSVKDYGSQYKFYDMLPNIYKVPNIAEGIDSPENPTLRSFLAIFGFYYDILKTYAELAGKRYKIESLYGNLIPPALQQFNFQYQPELGFRRSRSLIANALDIYQSKGSTAGTELYIKSLTGETTKLVQGKNLFLDSNDASFEHSSTDNPSGRWVTTGGTLVGAVAVPITSWSSSGTTLTIKTVYNSKTSATFSSGVYVYGTSSVDGAYKTGVVTSTTTNTNQQVATTTLTITTSTSLPTASGTTGYVYPTPVLPYFETGAPSTAPANSSQGLGVLTATASGTVTSGCGLTDTVQQSIPVTSGMSYTFGYRVYSVSAAKSFKATINWYDYRGNLLSTSTSASATTSSTTSWTLVSVTASAPSTAYFAVPGISTTSAAVGNIHYIDGCQLEKSGAATYFQDARQIQVYVEPDRINLCATPNFQISIGSWTAVNGTAAVAIGEGLSLSASNIPYAANQMEVYSTGTSDVNIIYTTNTSQYMPVNAGQQYTFSVNLVTSDDNSPTVGYNAYLAIDWYNSSNTLISTTESPIYQTPLDPANPTTYSLTDISPSTATSANIRVVWLAPLGAGYGLRLSNVIFENQPYYIDFFDGDYGYADVDDTFWSGTVGASTSYYYKNKDATKGVLTATLGSFLPHGSNFAIYYQSM